MRKIIVFNHITLDGYFSGPNGELDWSGKDDGESIDLAREGQNQVDTFIFGRKTFEMMAGYWPLPEVAEQNPVFAGVLNFNRKIVFSKTLMKTNWQPTLIVKEIDPKMIQGWKKEPGGNMMIFGSGTIVQQLTALGLIDEYQLILTPVLLGAGKQMFAYSGRRTDLKLVETRSFRSGNVMLVYRPVGEQA